MANQFPRAGREPTAYASEVARSTNSATAPHDRPCHGHRPGCRAAGLERRDVVSWRALYGQALAAATMERNLVRAYFGTMRTTLVYDPLGISILPHVFTPDMVRRLNRRQDAPSPPTTPVPQQDPLAIDCAVVLDSD